MLIWSEAHYVSRSVLYLPMTNVCGIHTFATIQLVLIIHVACESSTGVQHYIQFVTELIFEPKYDSYTGLSFSDHCLGWFTQRIQIL